MADDLEPARQIVQHLGHVGADLAQRAAALRAGATGRAVLDLLAWQVRRQGLAAATRRRRVRRRFRRKRIQLGVRLRLQLFQSQFQLRNLFAQTFRGAAKLHAAQPRQLHPQPLRLQRLVAQPGLGQRASLALRRQIYQQAGDHTAQCDGIVGQCCKVDGQ